MTNQNDVRVVLTDKAYTAFDTLVNNFGLIESVEDATKKLEENKLSRVVLLMQTIKNCVRGIISQNNLPSSLEKNLEISSEKAQQISKEILANIVPYIEKIPEDKFTNPVPTPDVEEKIFTEPNLVSSQSGITDKTPTKQEFMPAKSPSPKLVQKTKSTEPDKYREPPL